MNFGLPDISAAVGLAVPPVSSKVLISMLRSPTMQINTSNDVEVTAKRCRSRPSLTIEINLSHSVSMPRTQGAYLGAD